MRYIWTTASIGCLLAGISLSAVADDEGRRIEEVIVTAEKVEATVSDTSISITAIGSEMLEDMGIQSANEFVNYIPATTRDDYDIRIRGVGRNFRALGGDPGTAVALLSFYRSLRRRFRIRQAIGRILSITCGYIQGCALSILVNNCTFHLLSVRTASVAPNVRAPLFIDDNRLSCRGLCTLSFVLCPLYFVLQTG